MKIIDIDALSNRYQVSKSVIASTLYEGNEYPGQALGRIMKLGCDIKASQIIALANLLGCRPGDVFATPPGSYKHTTEPSGLHVFTRDGGVRVTLDASTGVTLIYLDGEQVMKTVVTDTAIPMDVYHDHIDGLIEEYREAPVGA